MKGNCIDTGGNIRKMLPTGPLDDSAIDHAKAFMVTPKKNRSRSRRLVDIAIDAMEGTDDDVAIDHAKAFMTTPRKKKIQRMQWIMIRILAMWKIPKWMDQQ
jgi:hypothetical protein